MKKPLSFVLCLIMVISAFSVGAMAATPEAKVAETIGTTTTEKTYDTLGAAVTAANASTADKVTIKVLENCSIKGTIELLRPMSIIGDNKTVTITGGAYGFRVGKGKGGEYSFDNINITTDTALSCVSIQAYDELNRVSVAISDSTLTNNKKTAVDYEGTNSGTDNNYFDLSVSDCTLISTDMGYGIGSGLDNNAPNVSTSTIAVEKSTFDAPEGKLSTYCIHCPKVLKSISVKNCTFSNAKGGIKYQYSGNTDSKVIIKNSDFSKCRTGENTGFAIMATNIISDISDKNSYCWATELSGNNFSDQNVLLNARADLEVIWFPDDTNTCDAGTRFLASAYSKHKTNLTAFNITDSYLSFTVGDGSKESSYYYNSKRKSGAYTNAADITEYWKTSPAHYSSGVTTNWTQANQITRWSLDSRELVQDTKVNSDGSVTKLSTYSAENATARVIVDTTTGKITVTPKAVGSTPLVATVGGGVDGKLPNSKSNALLIYVDPFIPPSGSPVIPTASPVVPTASPVVPNTPPVVPNAPPIVPVTPAGDTLAELNRDEHYAYINGYPDGSVRPDTAITRAEVLLSSSVCLPIPAVKRCGAGPTNSPTSKQAHGITTPYPLWQTPKLSRVIPTERSSRTLP